MPARASRRPSWSSTVQSREIRSSRASRRTGRRSLPQAGPCSPSAWSTWTRPTRSAPPAAEVSSPITAVLDLRDRPTWDMAALLTPNPEALWGQQPLVPLGALAQVHAARSDAEDDEPVVAPGGVDSATGNVR